MVELATIEPGVRADLATQGGSTFTLDHMDEVIGIALGVVVTLTGRLVVSVLTFRHWRGESLDGQEGRVHGAAGALSFVRDGHRVVTITGQLFVGIAFYVLLVAGLIAYAVTV